MSIYTPLLNKVGSEKLIRFLSSKPHIDAEVLFGVYSNNCAGNGICKVMPKKEVSKNACKCCSSYLKIYNFFDHLLFYFPASQINENARRDYFTNASFFQAEDLVIPNDFLRKIGLNSYVIQQGQHPIWNWHQDVLILFGKAF